MKPLMYQGQVYHKRFLPVENTFLYRAIYMRFDIDKVSELKNRFFSINRFNLMSFYHRDHGLRVDDSNSLRKWACEILDKAGVPDYKGRIELQTFPRVLGYVFLPVSFWYCYEGEKLRAIICEVNNTFGESFNYVLTDPCYKRRLHKEFHVSPFFDVEGNYQFDFTKKDCATINYEKEGQLLFSASISGEPVGWSSSLILKLFLKNPVFTFAVVFLIHYQALKLFIKKLKFYKKPEPPKKDINHEYF